MCCSTAVRERAKLTGLTSGMLSTWRRRATLTFFVLCAGVVLSAAASAEPSAGPPARSKVVVTFGLGPADAHGVDGRPYYYYLASGGSNLHDHVVVQNYSSTPLPLALYATDGVNTYAGAEDLLAAAERPKDLGSWIHLGSPEQIVVPPRSNNRPGSMLVPFRLTIPSSAEPGDHVGGIVVALRTHAKNAKGFVVDLDQRVAVQVFLRIAGELRPRLTVTDLHASYHGTMNPFGTGRTEINYIVHNVGNVRLGGQPSASVSGFFGHWSGSRLPRIPLLVPGGSAHMRASVPGVWPEIRLHAAVRVTSLALATDVNPPVRAASASQGFWAVPWATLALIVLVWLLLRHGRRLWHRSLPPSPPLTPLQDAPPPPPVVLPASASTQRWTIPPDASERPSVSEMVGDTPLTPADPLEAEVVPSGGASDANNDSSEPLPPVVLPVPASRRQWTIPPSSTEPESATLPATGHPTEPAVVPPTRPSHDNNESSEPQA